MPTYVYGIKSGAAGGCAACTPGFETVQKMSDAALTRCPQCGAEIERRIQAPMLSQSDKLKGPSAGAIAKAGFTQYKRQGKGYYEKSFGKGPSSLHG